MLRAAIPLLLGLVIARSLDVPLVVCYPTTIILVVVWAVSAFRPTSYALRWRTGMLLPLGWIALGVTVARLHDPRFRPDDVGRLADTAQGWRVTVQELVSDNGRTVRAWAEADAAVADTIQGASGVLLLTLLKDSLHPPPAVGARLLVAARAEALDRVPDPGGFDQRQWAATHGARYGCFAPQGRWAIIGERSHGPQLFQGMRDRITVWLEASGLPGPERALVKAVLLGVRDEMDQGQKQDFIRSGTVHVLAVSGSHVAIIYISIAGGLSFLGKKRQGRWVRGAITLLMLWLYAGITGFSPSVLRATLTFSLFVLADMGGWRTGALNSLASAAVLLLLWDPGMMVQPGFQLSFLAVLGIVMFYRPLMDRWAAPDPVLHYFWSLCAVSLAAQAFTLPLSLYLFHAFPIWFLPANLVVVGLVGISVHGGILLLVCHRVQVLGAFVAQLMEWLLLGLGRSAAFFAGLPGAYPPVRIDGLQCSCLYALLLLAAAWMFGIWRGARWGVLALVLVFTGTAARNTDRRNGQVCFTVYDDRNTTTLSVERGRALLVFGDVNDPWSQRKVEAHRLAHGVDTVQWSPAGPGSLRCGELVVQIDPDVAQGSPCRPDVVVLMHDRRWAMDRMAAAWKPSTQVVLGPSMPARRRSHVRGWCAAHGVAVHDVKEQGAYVRTDARGVDTLAPGAR